MRENNQEIVPNKKNFARWLKNSGLTRDDLAVLLKMSPASVTWFKKSHGHTLPNLKAAVILHVLSNEEIPLNGWFSKKDLKHIKTATRR